mmetsp:Transcript_27823/g.70297  ORF Transcript_27823/g.70297 Transcript_27823/m.70297 type:complete len:200 (+) Transcript_27823:1169-1768(+)
MYSERSSAFSMSVFSTGPPRVTAEAATVSYPPPTMPLSTASQLRVPSTPDLPFLSFFFFSFSRFFSFFFFFFSSRSRFLSSESSTLSSVSSEPVSRESKSSSPTMTSVLPWCSMPSPSFLSRTLISQLPRLQLRSLQCAVVGGLATWGARATVCASVSHPQVGASRSRIMGSSNIGSACSNKYLLYKVSISCANAFWGP